MRPELRFQVGFLHVDLHSETGFPWHFRLPGAPRLGFIRGCFDFTTLFHGRRRPGTAPVTLSSSAPSEAVIGTRSLHSNNHAVHINQLLTYSKFRATI